jgi:hypothetical protein
VTTVQLLIDAGERVHPRFLPTGLDDLDELLRAAFTRQQAAPGTGAAVAE